MDYRTQAEKGKDAEPEADGLRCSRCNVPVPRTAEPRCPQCLRRTTIVDPRGLTVVEAETVLPDMGTQSVGAPTRVVWPFNQTCPICAAAEVSEASVILRISKVASGFGTVTAGLLVRIRCCETCRARIVKLEWTRYAAIAGFFVGMFLLFAFFVQQIALGVVGTVLVVGSLLLTTTKNRRARAVLDESGLTAQLADLVPAPSGMIEQEHFVLHANPPSGREVVDLLDVLRQRKLGPRGS